MTIEIKIPSDNKPLAAAIGAALSAYANGETLGHPCVTSNEPTVERKIGKAPTVEKPLAETVTEQASSTETLNSAAVGASTTSSEKKQQVDAASAGTSTTQQDATLQTAGSANAALAGNATDNLDEKGVGFNAAYCSQAKVPFNQTGKKKGQWKRRQGVAEEAYDAWHAASVLAAPASIIGEERIDETADVTDINTAGAFTNGEQQINTAGAFQNGEQINNGQNHQPQEQGAKTFADAGEFMQWLSEQQAANLITSGDIDSAYAATSSSMGDLFDPSKAADAVVAVYNFLAPIAAGQQ